MGGEGSSYSLGTSPWCPPRAMCRGPCGSLRRGPCAAAAARATRPVLLGWLGHWYSHSGHGTPGPASWAAPLPLALLGVRESRGQSSSNTSCLQPTVWALCPRGMLSLSISLPSHRPLGDPRAFAYTKVRAKAWILPLYKCFLTTYYPVLGTEAGTEKDLLLWRNSPGEFFNLSKVHSHLWSQIITIITIASIIKC